MMISLLLHNAKLIRISFLNTCRFVSSNTSPAPLADWQFSYEASELTGHTFGQQLAVVDLFHSTSQQCQVQLTNFHKVLIDVSTPQAMFNYKLYKKQLTNNKTVICIKISSCLK